MEICQGRKMYKVNNTVTLNKSKNIYIYICYFQGGLSFFISLKQKITPPHPPPCCNTDCPCARVASAAWATGCTKEAPYCFMSSTASSTCPGVQGGGESWRTSYFLGVFRKKQTFGQNEMATKKYPFNTLFQKCRKVYCIVGGYLTLVFTVYSQLTI